MLSIARRLTCTLATTALLSTAIGSAAFAAEPGAPSRDGGRPAEGAKGNASGPAEGDVIPNEYVVQVRPGHDPKGLANKHGAKLRHVFRSALNGFSGELSPGQAKKLRKDPDVVTMEPNRRLQGSATQTMNGYGEPWGLDRSDQRYLGLSRTFTYGSTGTGVRAYIIDSGIRTSHPEFGGRASAAYDAFGGNGQDCHGHGTHVAGTVGGATYGMAKNVMLRGVRVLDCYNSGTTARLIAGIDWVRANHVKPAVANISISTRSGPDAAVVTATNNLANAGVFVAAAAGNDNRLACDSSPANAAGALTVAGSDSRDVRYSYSNHGACVDVYAPGVNILSAALNGGARYDTGTSMAAPHVTGMVAAAKAWYGDYYTSAAWRDWVKGHATTNVIYYNPANTPNRLLFKGGL